jgi:hypothetical protein
VKQAVAFARGGEPEKGLEALRPALLSSEHLQRAGALATAARCFEIMEDLPAACYLTGEAIRLDPENEKLSEALARCRKAYREKIEKAGRHKPGMWGMASAGLIALASCLVFAFSVPSILSDLVVYFFILDPTEHAVVLMGVAGLGMGVAGLLLLAWFVRRLRARGRVRRATGEDFSDKSHHFCWACGLRFRVKLKTCPFCASPPEPPVIPAAPEVPEAAPPPVPPPLPSPAGGEGPPPLPPEALAVPLNEPPPDLSEWPTNLEPAVGGTPAPAAAVEPPVPARSLQSLKLVNILAIVGLVAGGLGLLISLIPCVGWFRILLAVPALAVAAAALIVAFAKHARKGLAIAAVAVAFLGVLVPVGELLLLKSAVAPAWAKRSSSGRRSWFRLPRLIPFKYEGTWAIDQQSRSSLFMFHPRLLITRKGDTYEIASQPQEPPQMLQMDARLKDDCLQFDFGMSRFEYVPEGRNYLKVRIVGIGNSVMAAGRYKRE